MTWGMVSLLRRHRRLPKLIRNVLIEMGWRATGVYFLAFSLSRPESPLTARLAPSRSKYAH
jgi:hypothetical protein